MHTNLQLSTHEDVSVHFLNGPIGFIALRILQEHTTNQSAIGPFQDIDLLQGPVLLELGPQQFIGYFVGNIPNNDAILVVGKFATSFADRVLAEALVVVVVSMVEGVFPIPGRFHIFLGETHD